MEYVPMEDGSGVVVGGGGGKGGGAAAAAYAAAANSAAAAQAAQQQAQQQAAAAAAVLAVTTHATTGQKGPRGMKKKGQKGTKASGGAGGGAGPKGGGAGAAAGGAAGAAGAAAGATRKKKVKDEVVFDSSDLHAPLPVNLRVWCKSNMTNRYHEAKVLDRKTKDDKFKIQSVPWPPSPNPPLPVVEGVQPDFSAHTHIYYIHYLEWDRRMDEWVYRDRICLGNQLALLQPPSYNIVPADKKDEASSSSAAAAASTVGAGGKEKKDGEEEEEDEKEDEAANANASKAKKKGKSEGTGAGNGKNGGADATAKSSAAASDAASAAAAAALAAGGAAGAHIAGGDPHGGSLGGHGNFSEEDIKAHEEATKVKNIESIVMGKYHMSTWYYSPFPSEYNQYNVLHFCEFCLNFFGYEEELKRHSRKCTLRHPPGNEIYRSDEKNVRVSVWEVDGAREKVYCQNLAYIAKLFLDHKTLEFDCEIDETGYHIVGYFSKEKISQSKFNLACILTLPCHQRKGYGKLIISLSYELSKIEEKVGSPEKPISDLGKVSYMSYWSSTLLKLLQQRPWGGEAISIEDLSRMTCITTDDIIETLKALHILIWYKGKWVFSDTALQQCIKEREEKRMELAKKVEDPTAIFVSQCRAERLHWTPFFVKSSAKKRDQ